MRRTWRCWLGYRGCGPERGPVLEDSNDSHPA
jgi:hypothetical protein